MRPPIVIDLIEITRKDNKLPKEWLSGTTVFLFKKKDPKKLDNYRPVTLLNIIYKIWAIVITNRISPLMNHITSEMQTAYKKGRSTLDVLALVNNHMNKDDNASLILIDLSKAFDRINRKVLWTTLYESGIPINFINNIRAGHMNNALRPKVNGEQGTRQSNNTGVSKGSPLSALLFIISAERMMQSYSDKLPQMIKDKRPKLLTRNYEEEKKWTDLTVKLRYKNDDERKPHGQPNANNVYTRKWTIIHTLMTPQLNAETTTK